MALVNALYVAYSRGFVWVEDAPSITANGRREGYLTLGGADSLSEVDRIAEAIMASRAEPVVSTAASLEPVPADEPYVTWDVGDTITMPNEIGSATPMRVVALSMQADPEGNPIWTPELRSVENEQEQRSAQWLKRMSNGSLGGSVATAAPPSIGGLDLPLEPSQPGSEATPQALQLVIPPFSMDGTIVVAGPSPHWPFPFAGTITSVAVYLNIAGATNLGIDVYKNGTVISTASYPSATTGLQELGISNINYSVGDSIAVGTSNAPSGAVGLLVQPLLAT